MSSSSLFVRRIWESFGNTPCGANARTAVAQLNLSISAVSIIVPHVCMRSSIMITFFHDGFPSLRLTILRSPSRTLPQIICSTPGNISLNRFAAPSSGNTITSPGWRVRRPVVVWSSALIRSGLKSDCSTRA